MSDENGRADIFPVNAVRVKPEVKTKPDFYGAGGTFNPLVLRGGPASDFVRKPRTEWPQPTIAEGGTPATFLRDENYPFEPGAGLPKNVGKVTEEPTDLARRIDADVRPPQLIETEQVGLPFKPGEGRRYVGRADEPMDPSVISAGKMHVKRSRAGLPFDTFAISKARSGWRHSAMFGMGQLTTLASLALAPIENTMASLKSREDELLRLSPDTFRAATDPYASLRASIDTSYAAIKADPTKVTTEGIGFASAAATYKNVLDAALGKLQAALAPAPAAKPRTKVVTQIKEVIKEVPGAVVQVVKTPYGMIVLGAGAALIAGLLIARSLKK
jgi:hypothetical protein